MACGGFLRERDGRRSGMTLVEVMLAVFILAVCLPRRTSGQTAKSENQTAFAGNLFLALSGLERL